MRKRRKLKKVVVVIIIVLIVILLLSFSPFLFINIRLIGNNKMNLDYGEKYSEPGYKAFIFNKEITKDIKVVNDIKDNVGAYEVVYSYKFLFYKIKRVRKIKVSDLSGPEITLKGDKELSITINTSYNEPGYEAIDKLDGNLTSSVKITNNIDITKLGEYDVVYKVKDKVGNTTKTIRKVKVEKLKPTQMSVAEYTLDGWYDEVKLKETPNKGNDYFNRITMVGDSNTKNMYLTGYLTGLRAWAVPCLHAESMHNTNLYLYGLGKQMLLLDAVSQYKPEIMILNFGTFSTAWIGEDTFLEYANAMINSIKEKSPDTKIILTSLYPIRKGYNINSFTQEAINKLNFLILEMASEHNLKFLDVQTALKGPDGYGQAQYFVGDNFHLTSQGHSAVKEYIKTHALEEV